jgi:hypothetical protein
MKRLDVTILAIGTAVLAIGFQGANASEDSEYEREGWAALERSQTERTEASAPQASAAYESISSDRMPFEQSLLDRGAVGVPERVLLAQIGGMSYKSGEESASPWADDHDFIAPAQ